MARSACKTMLFGLILLLQGFAALPVNAQASKWSWEKAQEQYQRGEVFSDMGDYNSAIRAYFQSLQNHPAFAPSYWGMAETYKAQDQFLEGIQILRTLYDRKDWPVPGKIDSLITILREQIPSQISLLQSLYAHRVKLTEDALDTFCRQSRVSSETIFDYLDSQNMQLSERSCQRVAEFAAAALRSTDSNEHLQLGRQYDYAEEDVVRFASFLEKCGPILTFSISNIRREQLTHNIYIEGTVKSTKGLSQLLIGDKIWPVTPGEEWVSFADNFIYDAAKIVLVAVDMDGNKRVRGVATEPLEQRIDRWINQAIKTIDNLSPNEQTTSLAVWGIVEENDKKLINLFGSEYDFSKFALLFADHLRDRLFRNLSTIDNRKITLESSPNDAIHIINGTYVGGDIIAIRLQITDIRNGIDIFTETIQIEKNDFPIGTDFRTPYRMSAGKR